MVPIYQVIRKATAFEWDLNEQDTPEARQQASLSWIPWTHICHLSYMLQQPLNSLMGACGKRTVLQAIMSSPNGLKHKHPLRGTYWPLIGPCWTSAVINS